MEYSYSGEDSSCGFRERGRRTGEEKQREMKRMNNGKSEARGRERERER